ncbi:Probable cinnamyl alcohol dehydrogenase 6, partial [Linum perenne]
CLPNTLFQLALPRINYSSFVIYFRWLTFSFVFPINCSENGDTDVTIDILYCGICHTDLHQAKNDWGMTMYPIVPGHEITGIITKVGKKVEGFKVGDRGYVVHVPESLPMDAAAPLLCAGITVFTPLKDHNLVESPRKKIGVVGLGGLGHVAVKFGKAFGHHVTVISTSPSKEKEARERLGADDFIISTNPTHMQAGMRTIDFIIDTVSADHSLGPILELLKVNGTLVVVGAPSNGFELPTFPLIFGKRTVKGGIIGGMKETQEMMDLCGKYNITCDVEVLKPDSINQAFQRLAANDVKYRFVIDIAGSKSRPNL